MISFGAKLDSVFEVNGLEELIGEASFSGNRLEIKLGANEIKAYRVKLRAKKLSPKENWMKLDLNFNTRLIGRKGEKGTVIFPEEITPSKVGTGQFHFSLAVGEKMNAVRCKGQKIGIPAGYDHLSLLVGSDEDCNAAFSWLGGDNGIISETTCEIPSMVNFIGQWDSRIWKKEPKHHLKKSRDYAWLNTCIGIKPGYINRCRIEWYATHTYRHGSNMSYRYGYMYNLDMCIAGGAQSLMLPEIGEIYLFAAEVSRRSFGIENTRKLRDKYDF